MSRRGQGAFALAPLKSEGNWELGRRTSPLLLRPLGPCDRAGKNVFPYFAASRKRSEFPVFLRPRQTSRQLFLANVAY